MKENDLRLVMQRLNVPVGRKTPSGWMNGKCPLAQWTHKNGSDKTASFGVMVVEGGRSTFNCYGCKQKGTINQLIRKLEAYRNQSYEAVREMAGSAEDGISTIPDFETPIVEEETPVPLDEDMFYGLYDDIETSPAAMAFLAKRRISLDAARKIGLEYDPDKKRVTFPVRGRDGALYGYSGRSIIKDAKLKALDYFGLPKRHLILGAHLWEEGKPVVIVEGLTGFARQITEGVDEVANVGALLGSVMTDEKAALLAEFGHGVFLLLDPDPAGDDGIYGANDVLLKRRKIEDSAIGKLWGQVPLFIPDYPEGVEDIDDVTKAHVEVMLRETPLYTPDPWALKILKGPR